MSSKLALKIKELADKKKISIMALEKAAGLKTSAIKNILVGTSKKPSAEMLLAVSRALGCTIGDLLEEEPVEEAKKTIFEDIIFENKDLFKETVVFFSLFYKKNNLPIHGKIFYESLVHVYTYLNENNQGLFDEKFAQWVLERYFKP